MVRYAGILYPGSGEDFNREVGAIEANPDLPLNLVNMLNLLVNPSASKSQ